MRGLRWFREIALIALMYAIYSLLRGALGDRAGVAEDNAARIVSLERAIGLFHERSVQQLLDDPSFIRPINTFYALAHFIVTGGLLLWLFLRSRRYAQWRNALVATSGLALVGYAVFPLMPPRLYPDDGIVGTLQQYGAPWTYSGESIGRISNQFAAMPSLHVAWALWCTWVVWSEVRRAVARVIAVAYSLIAVVSVVATGNHYFLDVVGAVLVLLAGAYIANRLRLRGLRRERTTAVPASEAPASEARASEARPPSAPAPKAPASSAPVADVPASEAPASSVPAPSAPASGAPAADAPASEAAPSAPASGAASPSAPASEAVVAPVDRDHVRGVIGARPAREVHRKSTQILR